MRHGDMRSITSIPFLRGNRSKKLQRRAFFKRGGAQRSPD